MCYFLGVQISFFFPPMLCTILMSKNLWGLSLARALRLAHQWTFGLHEPRVLAFFLPSFAGIALCQNSGKRAVWKRGLSLFFDFASLKCELQIGIYAAHRAWSHRLGRVWKTGAIAEWRNLTMGCTAAGSIRCRLPLSVTFSGWGLWKTALSSFNSIRTQEPFPSEFFAPRDSKNFSIFFHSISDWRGFLKILW